MARSDQVFYWREELERQLGFAQSVRAGGTVYFSGVVSIDMVGAVLDAGDMEAQVRNIYGELQNLLVYHGLTFENVVKETIYTTDMDALVAAAATRKAFFGKYSPPAATWVEVRRLAFEGAVIEVDLTLFMP
ncbi:hypothetical protein HY78_18530 [Rhizorhabdus wittichii DC-6]|nr:hypothetical protein HY78_18530 [Rhizorhabdus wittichii DC-6]